LLTAIEARSFVDDLKLFSKPENISNVVALMRQGEGVHRGELNLAVNTAPYAFVKGSSKAHGTHLLQLAQVQLRLL
jgi:hypothetical protein